MSYEEGLAANVAYHTMEKLPREGDYGISFSLRVFKDETDPQLRDSLARFVSRAGGWRTFPRTE